MVSLEQVEFYALRRSCQPPHQRAQFFSYDNNVQVNYIRRVLNNEFEMELQEHQRYNPFEDQLGITKTGTPFLFKKEDFCENVKDLNEELTPY